MQPSFFPSRASEDNLKFKEERTEKYYVSKSQAIPVNSSRTKSGLSLDQFEINYKLDKMPLNFTKRQWLTLIVMGLTDFCNAVCVSLQVRNDWKVPESFPKTN